jgi:tetratricopeptide (TPR) repeat protein
LGGATDQAQLLLDDLIQDLNSEGQDQWQPYFVRGYLRQINHGLADAIVDYTQAIQQKPNLAVALNNRGVIYAMLEQPARALTDLNQAIQSQPELPQPWLNRGLITSSTDPMAALADFTMALNLNPIYHQALLSRGDAYVHLGNYEQALLNFSPAIQVAQDDPIGYVKRGRVEAALTHYREAIADFQQALVLDRTNSDASLNLGLAYLNQSSYDAALQQFQYTATLAQTSQRPDVEAYSLYCMGLTYVRKGMYQEALDHYQQSLALAQQIHDGSMAAQIQTSLNQVRQALGLK